MEKRHSLRLCVCVLLGLYVLLLLLGCPDIGNSSSESRNDTSTDEANDGLYDPYAAVRQNVSENSIYCDEDACCWWDCSWEVVVCGQQSGTFAPVGSTLDNFDLDNAPDWWREGRFYLTSNYEVNILPGRTTNEMPSIYYVANYCASSIQNTAYTRYLAFADYTAFQGFLDTGIDSSTIGQNCTTALQYCAGACVPSCSGRQCGSDGCGGSCGTCGSGQTCNQYGQCVSSGSSGDPCWNCISSCRGLPGCCTGCGCICQDVCGMCW